MILSYALQQELSKLLSLEVQLVDVLPKIASFVQHPRLNLLLRRHHHETHLQIARLKQGAATLPFELPTLRCPTAQELMDDLYLIVDMPLTSVAGDLMLANKLRLVKHYSSLAYDKARKYAQNAGYSTLIALLHASHEEEKNTEEELADIILRDLIAHFPRHYQPV